MHPLTCLAWFAVAAITALTVAGWFGPWYEPLDVLSNFRLHLVFLAGAVALLFLRRNNVVIAATALLAVNLASAMLYPHRVIATGAHASVRELKVVTFNTLWRADNAAGIARFLEKEKPDIVVLQEVGAAKWARLEPLVAAAYPWRAQCAAQSQCRVALLSRHRWKNASAAFSGSARLPVARADFGPELGNLSFVGVHFHRPLGWSSLHRLQAEHAHHLARAARGPAVFAGDFNAAPWTRTIRGFAETGLEPAGWVRPTWPRRMSQLVKLPLPPQLALDHILLPRGAVLRDVRSGPDLGSDHMPVIARFDLPAAR
ncbi:MAG: endonuclease/exonuclease/phosphatase family protein [Hyphomicrobiales bacterium]